MIEKAQIKAAVRMEVSNKIRAQAADLAQLLSNHFPSYTITGEDMRYARDQLRKIADDIYEQAQTEPTLDSLVGDLDLSVRVRNAIARYEPTLTVRKALLVADDQYMKIPGMWYKGVKELRAALEDVQRKARIQKAE